MLTEKCDGNDELLSAHESGRLTAMKTYADHIKTVYNRQDPAEEQ